MIALQSFDQKMDIRHETVVYRHHNLFQLAGLVQAMACQHCLRLRHRSPRRILQLASLLCPSCQVQHPRHSLSLLSHRPLPSQLQLLQPPPPLSATLLRLLPSPMIEESMDLVILVFLSTNCRSELGIRLVLANVLFCKLIDECYSIGVRVAWLCFWELLLGTQSNTIFVAVNDRI